MGAEKKPAITPETRVGELLDAYPQLEEALIRMAPAFAKPKNPLLRRTVARAGNCLLLAPINADAATAGSAPAGGYLTPRTNFWALFPVSTSPV